MNHIVTDNEYLEIMKKHDLYIIGDDYKSIVSKSKKYGVDTKSLILLWDTQDGKCAICKITLTVNKSDTNTQGVVDHCHKSGNVRGWLCKKCNVHVGVVDRMTNMDILSSINLNSRNRLRVVLRKLNHDSFMRIVSYCLENVDLLTSLPKGKQAHDMKSTEFLSKIPKSVRFYDITNITPKERYLVLLWFKKNGIKGDILSGNVSSVVRVETSEEKCKAFEDRFVMENQEDD
jgi:hypothetical protein